MARQHLLRTKTLAVASASEKPLWLWDDAVRGLGCRVYPSGAKVFYVSYRTLSGTPRRLKLGQLGQLTLEGARDAAREILGSVRAGRDPANDRRMGRAAPSVNDLAERYLKEHARPHKKPSSVNMDETNLRLHVLPALGSHKVVEVTHPEIVRLHQRIGLAAPGAANRVLSLASKMFNLAEKWGLRAAGTNPAKHVHRFRENKVERYLRPDEYNALGRAISTLERDGGVEPVAAAVFRLLMFTGCRLGEVLGLQRRDVDLDRRELVLRDAKAGGRRVCLNDTAAAEVRNCLRVTGVPNAWLFARPGREGEALSDAWVWHRWKKIQNAAGLTDLRIHDLRHGLASVAAAEGLSLLAIGKLLGHRTPATTARYAHLVDDPLRAAAQAVGKRIRLDVDGNDVTDERSMTPETAT